MDPRQEEIALAWMDMHRVEGGKIVESWHVEDYAGMPAQLGATG
jgi:predicted SnoaL-like aldol condensation-catalyzing enzyme